MKKGYLANPKPENPVLQTSEADEAPNVQQKGPISVPLIYGEIEAEDSEDVVKLARPVFGELPFETVKYEDENLMVLTSLPAQTIDHKEDPYGSAQCLLSAKHKLEVLNTPGFPKRAPITDQNAYEVRDMPDPKMGKGVFATKNLPFGTIVIAERPILIVPADISFRLGGFEPGMQTMQQHQLALLKRAEEVIQVAVDTRMSKHKREAYLALANSHTDDGSGPLVGILRTNGFRAGLLGGDSTNFGNMYSGVVKIGSRLNHSCYNNLNVTFSIPSFSFQFTASRDIKKGEELTCPYVSPSFPLAKRRAELAPYGFTCKCRLCTPPFYTSASDDFRLTYRDVASQFGDQFKAWVAQPSFVFTQAIIQPLLEFVETLEQEGLTSFPGYLLLSVLLFQAYTRARLYTKAAKWERKARVLIDMPRDE